MGLLTNLLGLSPEQTQGLLGFSSALAQSAGPSRFPTSGAQGLAAALQGYQQGVQGYQDREQQKALQALRLRGLQGEIDDQERARKKANEFDQAAIDSVMTPEQQALAGGGGPTLANAARIPSMTGGFDTEGFLRRGMGIDPVRALELRKALAPPTKKVKNWSEVQQDGKVMYAPFFEDGTAGDPVPLEVARKMEFRDTGGKTVGLDPYTGKVGASLTNTVSPSTAASNALGWANYQLSRENASRPQFSAEAGGFVLPPSAANPSGKLLPVAGVGGKSPTEFQGKSAAFDLRATEADKILRNLDGQYSAAGVNLKNALGDVWGVCGALGAGANALLSDSSQRVDQAQRDFVNALLRQESGAAIGAGEFDNAAKQYFPQPGDSQAVKAQKARNRALAIQGLQANAGRAAMSAPVATGGWSITKVE